MKVLKMTKFILKLRYCVSMKTDDVSEAKQKHLGTILAAV